MNEFVSLMLSLGNAAIDHSVELPEKRLIQVNLKAKNIAEKVPGAVRRLGAMKPIGEGLSAEQVEVLVDGAPKALFVSNLTLRALKRVD